MIVMCVLMSKSIVLAPFSIFSIAFTNWYEIDLRINWFAILVFAFVSFFVVKGAKKLFKRKTSRRVTLEGIQIGLNDFSCTLTCGNDVQEIAYQLWVELTTRKLAIPIEEDDVIIEILDSWYAAFSAIRELFKSIPGNCLQDASDLVNVTTKVLNEGLRPHLTKWQAKYRAWYKYEENNSTESPQEIQKRYPKYDELVTDLKDTNQHLIAFANKLYEIAFGKKQENL